MEVSIRFDRGAGEASELATAIRKVAARFESPKLRFFQNMEGVYIRHLSWNDAWEFATRIMVEVRRHGGDRINSARIVVGDDFVDPPPPEEWIKSVLDKKRKEQKD